MNEFKNKIVLITGGTSGIGLATAKYFANENAQVIVTGRNKKNLNESGNIRFIQSDVSSAEDIKELFNLITSDYKTLDIAVNNAGITGTFDQKIHEMEENEWNSVLNVNLTGLWLCMKYEIQLMLGKQASIINVSSIAGLRAGKVNAAYTSSKHAVIGLTKAAAVEYAKSGIRVNAVCPGPIDTPMISSDKASIKTMAEQIIPMGRCGEPEEVANIIGYLCSPKSSFITGIAMPIDGGSLA